MAELVEPETIFGSADAAMRFAFSERYGELAETILGKMSGPRSGRGNGLFGLDGYGQAGLILAALSELPDWELQIVTAVYSPVSGPCACGSACCLGFRPFPRWLMAVNAITERVGQEIPATLPHRKLREAAVRRFFGEKVRLIEVADECRVHRNTASQHNSKICDLLKANRYQSIRAATEQLQAVGMV